MNKKRIITVVAVVIVLITVTALCLFLFKERSNGMDAANSDLSTSEPDIPRKMKKAALIVDEKTLIKNGGHSFTLGEFPGTEFRIVTGKGMIMRKNGEEKGVIYDNVISAFSYDVNKDRYPEICVNTWQPTFITQMAYASTWQDRDTPVRMNCKVLVYDLKNDLCYNVSSSYYSYLKIKDGDLYIMNRCEFATRDKPNTYEKEWLLDSLSFEKTGYIYISPDYSFNLPENAEEKIETDVYEPGEAELIGFAGLKHINRNSSEEVSSEIESRLYPGVKLKLVSNSEGLSKYLYENGKTYQTKWNGNDFILCDLNEDGHPEIITFGNSFYLDHYSLKILTAYDYYNGRTYNYHLNDKAYNSAPFISDGMAFAKIHAVYPLTGIEQRYGTNAYVLYPPGRIESIESIGYGYLVLSKDGKLYIDTVSGLK